ncbi:beta-galactosidase [Agromyces luteolus]|uniref:Glycoside hydrolase family 2 protein n=1 Tax=Agromyces luteolus TaxID=88373 RepID=A0A7C9HJ07_9MICO|nr:glycoside hydrolase family 2 TIM barrel-domain containing protein [Agromyces luteolus]MUN08246.1 glycoside hydrolase family 2 protein [Agromyces luteolus]GLK26779.1 beta-galactosidase [Agromyces luteolus]
MTPAATHTRRVVTIHDGWAFAPVELSTASSWEDVATAGEQVVLPHTWNAFDGQAGGEYRRGRSTYARVIEPDAADDETWIEFAGVNSSAEVHFGGRLLARHDGGYSTFRVDLTEGLAAGARTLLVVVDNAANERVYPQQADFTFYGGIYREVRRITVGREHFDLGDHGGPGLTVTPTLEGDRAEVALLARAMVRDAATGVRFTVEGEAAATVPLVDGEAHATLAIERVRRWHGLRDPHLYTARAELLSGDTVLDTVDLRFGCREFAVDPERGFLLNGEEYPLRGVSRHQDREGVGNAITEEMKLQDLALLQELGVTTVRLAHYQHDQRFYDLCDEAGIVVWAEIPQITVFLPGATGNAGDQLTELIVQNRHHASIVCWGLSNEITLAGSGDEVVAAHRELNDLAHELDPTRLTAMANLFLLETDHPLVGLPDVMSYNLYFGWYVGEAADNDTWLDDFHAAYPEIAIGLAEYGADANAQFQSAAPEKGDYTEGYQALYHEHMLAMIEQRPWLWATHVWNLADFGSAGRDEGGAAGRNQKGLVSFDRTLKKDAFYLYKAAWSSEPFVHVAGRRRAERAEEVTEVIVYSNQDHVVLTVDGVEIGAVESRRAFRFRVPLTGEHEITARAGALTDTITLRKVDEVPAASVMPTTTIANWFDDAELPSPDGFYSVRDSLGDIKQSEDGARVIASVMEAVATSRGEVGHGVEIPPAMQAIVDRMSVEKLIKQAGGVSIETVAALNARLNLIAK